MKNSKLKLYSYDNFEGDKGIIVAASLEEAEEIYLEEYPNRKIAKCHEEYLDNGCYVSYEGLIEEGRLYCTCSW